MEESVVDPTSPDMVENRKHVEELLLEDTSTHPDHRMVHAAEG